MNELSAVTFAFLGLLWAASFLYNVKNPTPSPRCQVHLSCPCGARLDYEGSRSIIALADFMKIHPHSHDVTPPG